MTPIKYAIKCSTEEQARELMKIYEYKGWKRMDGQYPIDVLELIIKKRFICDTFSFENRFRNNDDYFFDLQGYNIITYEEAKDKGLLREISYDK